MIIKKLIYSMMVVAVVILPMAPSRVLAAVNDVTATDQTAVVYLSDTTGNYTIDSNLSVESFVVNTGSVVVTMPTGADIKLYSGDRHTLTFSGTESCGTEFTCGSDRSFAEVRCNVATTQVVTILASATVCQVPTGGGPQPVFPVAPVSSSASPTASPVATPVVTPPAATPATTAITPLTVVVPSVPVVSTPVLSVPSPSVVESDPGSPIQFSNVVSSSFQPGEALKFRYQYENTNETTTRVKIVRQLLNSKGKVVKQSTGSATLKPGSVYVRSISEAVGKNLSAGEYVVKVKTLDAKTNKVLDENSFTIEIEKQKKKMFVLGEVSVSDSALTFDQQKLAKVKSNVFLPVNFSLSYSYTNNTDVKQNIRMAREVMNENGTVVSSAKAGSWTMKPGEKDSLNTKQSLAGNLSAGNYTIRIRAYDKKTGELFAENSLGFSIELK